MSRQSQIDSYFKMKSSGSSSPKVEEKPTPVKKRKHNLSLIKPTTPTKSPKVSAENRSVQAEVNLCSDDDVIWENSPKLRIDYVDLTQRSTESGEESDATITYTPTLVKNETDSLFSSQGSEEDFLAPVANYSSTNKQADMTPPDHQHLHDLNSSSNLGSDNAPNCIKLDREEKSNSCVTDTPLSTEGNIKEELLKIEESSEGSEYNNIINNQTPQKYKEAQVFSTPQAGNSNACVTDTPLSTEGNIKGELLKSEESSPGSEHNNQTPQKCKVATSSQPQSSTVTPKMRDKFFSPTKKRNVVKRTPNNKSQNISPNTVKRSLGVEMSRTLPSRILFEDDLFTAACDGMDDKTIFLLEIINKCLNEPSITNLLDKEGQKLLTDCLQVVKPGMRVVCRLYWRKEGWYRHMEVSKICSEENEPIDDTCFQQMMDSLVDKKLIVKATAENMNLNDYAHILKRGELILICKELKLKANSKQDAIVALTSFSKQTVNMSNFVTGCKTSNSSRVLQMMHAKAGPSYRLSDLARNTLYKLYILMYIGMDYNIIREKRLELVLLYDKIKRETYPIDKDMELDNASVVFQTRDQFERYLTAHNIYEDFIVRTDVTDKCNIVKQVYNLYKSITEDEMANYISLPKWLYRYTPANIYVKILEKGVQDLKRDKSGSHNLLALDILSSLIGNATFRQHRKAEWYAEKALILHSSLYRYDEAAAVLLEGFKSNMSEEAKDAMRPRARKIARQKNGALTEHCMELQKFASKETVLENNLNSKHICKLPMDRIGTRGKIKFETRTQEGRMVQEAEEFCIGNYIYTEEYTNGEHWEGRIVTSLFFLLFWDIVYSKPPGGRGIFLSYYQLYPLDLFTEDFYTNRKESIDSWLSAIENASEDKLLNLVHDSWRNRPEVELSGISRGISLEQLKAVASCLQPRGVAAICRRLATNYRYSHSGFPDLTLWNAERKKIKFVEVKTDSDKPSMKQIQWMQYLKQHGIDTEFCYVGSHTTRQRARNNNINKKDETIESQVY